MEAQSTFHLPLTDVICQDGINANEDEVICGLVLAGGEGKRLQPFIKSLGKRDAAETVRQLYRQPFDVGAYDTTRGNNYPPGAHLHRYHSVPFAVSRGQATMFR